MALARVEIGQVVWFLGICDTIRTGQIISAGRKTLSILTVTGTIEFVNRKDCYETVEMLKPVIGTDALALGKLYRNGR